MGKRLRCKLGQHEWKLTGKGNDMICKFCGKEFDDGIVGDMNKKKWWQSHGDMGG